jgi:hypothetical protein
MARDRKELHKILKGILGSNQVYYNPPESIKMTYPAIRYSLEDIENVPADNLVYFQNIPYNVLLLDMEVDSDRMKAISKLPMCRLDRHYISDGIHHYSFNLYY